MLFAFVGALAGGWVLVATAVHAYGRRDETRPADAIVVMGAAQYDGRPSPVLRARLDHAIQLYRDGVSPTLIFTGGTGPGDTVSEARVGRRYAARSGIPERALLVEENGERSTQSVASVAALMQREGMQSAVFVSDPFHMLRLRLLTAREGIRAYSSPTRSSPISRNPQQEWAYTVRETLGVVATVVEAAAALVPPPSRR